MLSGIGLHRAETGETQGWARSLAHWGHQFVDCGDQATPPPSPKSHFQAHIQWPWAGLSTPTWPHHRESTDRLHHVRSGDSAPVKSVVLGKTWAAAAAEGAALHHQPWVALTVTFTLPIWWMRDRHPVPNFHIMSPCYIFPSKCVIFRAWIMPTAFLCQKSSSEQKEQGQIP